MLQQNLPPIIIKQSRGRLVLLLLGCLVFVGLGVWILTLPDSEVGGKGLIAAWIGIPFFGLIGLFAFGRLFSRKPAVVVDLHGITDNASALAAGFIPWANFAGAGIILVKKRKLIVIVLKDTNAYLSSLGPIKRTILKGNLALVGYVVAIPGVTFAMPVEELLATIEQYARATAAWPGQ